MIQIACPFRTITGFKCPGCGMTHAILDLLRLDPVAAFKENALFLPILLYIAAVIIYYLYSRFKLKEPRLSCGSPFIDKAFLVIVLAYWVLRNIPSLSFL